MPSTVRIALAQINVCVGDFSGNIQLHIDAIREAKAAKADLIVFPELSLIGYSAQDLLLRPSFIADAADALQQVAEACKDIHALVGHPFYKDAYLYNGCSLLHEGKIISQYAKQHLPNYDVFDEKRYFTQGHETVLFHINGIPMSCVICEDLWTASPVKRAREMGAKIILSPNASPFEVNKHEKRVEVLKKRVIENRVAIVYVNHCGAQDDLIFSGDSSVIDTQGELCHHSGFFSTNIKTVEITVDNDTITIPKSTINLPSKLHCIYHALMLATRDYVEKNNFPGVLIGLSGGIDSALVAAIATDALGADRVHGVTMPSRHTATMSNEDAYALAKNLNIGIDTIPIEPAYETFLALLVDNFEDTVIDVTEENIQSRCRAIILMALSNKFGKLVLTTGNRSELAVGYCTLYGDMAGGYAVLKDLPKTLVYEVAAYRNQMSPVIPERTLTRAPSAELADNQKDQDTLPPYPLLDEILDLYMNQSKSVTEIISLGFDEALVTKIIKLIKRNEYKRRQAPTGPHLNRKSFIHDWRYPITSKYRN